MDDYAARVAELSEAASREREGFDPPADPPDEERADRLLREGFGPSVWVYVEARTGGRTVRFDRGTFAALEAALNDWLELYAACYGVDYDADFTVREAAKLLLDTRNVHDTAALLTGVPERDRHKR